MERLREVAAVTQKEVWRVHRPEQCQALAANSVVEGCDGAMYLIESMVMYHIGDLQ